MFYQPVRKRRLRHRHVVGTWWLESCLVRASATAGSLATTHTVVFFPAVGAVLDMAEDSLPQVFVGNIASNKRGEVIEHGNTGDSRWHRQRFFLNVV